MLQLRRKTTKTFLTEQHSQEHLRVLAIVIIRHSFRIMFIVDSVGRHYWSALGQRYRSTLGRYVGGVAVDTRLTYWPIVGRTSAEFRSSIGRYVGRYLDRHSINIRSILGRYLSFEGLITGR